MRSNLFKIISTLLITTSLVGCATKSSDIRSIYVSPNEYASLSCKAMEHEMRDISQRVSTLTGKVDKEASKDAMQMGVGLVLFWPALLFLEGGNGALQSEYAHLKGKYEAVSTQYTRKGCADIN